MRNINLKIAFLLSVLALLFSSCQSTPVETDSAVVENLELKTADFIDVEGINIHYSDAGSGKPELLFLHGFLGNLYNWDEITPGLQQNYRTVAYDRLAFGFTERPLCIGDISPYTPEMAEERALKLMELLDISKPVLVGHSAGGNLAIRLALDNPDKFSALVLISPAIYNNGPPGIARFLISSGLFDKAGQKAIRNLPQQLDELLASSFYDPSALSAEKIDNYTAPLVLNGWDTALWEYTKAQGKNTISKRLQELELPVLIIHGRNDQVVPVEDSIKASAEIKDSVLVVLNECGHVAFEEKPRQTLATIETFLEGLE